MIEFEVLLGPDARRSSIVLNTSSVSSFEPAGAERSKIVLANGRELMAAISYATLRRLFLEARSGFATTFSQPLEANS